MAARDEAAFEAFVSAWSGDLLRTSMLLTHDRSPPRISSRRRW